MKSTGVVCLFIEREESEREASREVLEAEEGKKGDGWMGGWKEGFIPRAEV